MGKIPQETLRRYAGKTVLVTGATGLIGGAVARSLLDTGETRVIALSRSEEKLEAGFAEYSGHPGLSFIACDVSRMPQLPEPVDYVFHAAGPMEGGVIRDRPLSVIEPNTVGVMRCCDLLADQKARFGLDGRMVLFSSVTVYGNNTGIDRTVTESDTDVTSPLDSAGAAYSQSKRLSEVIASAYGRQCGIDAVIARLSTVYGYARFVPDTAFFEFIRRALEGKDIELSSSGAARRDNLYIDDAVDGLLRIGAAGVSGEAYNVSSNGDGGNFAAVDEIALHIARICNRLYSDTRRVEVRCGSEMAVARSAGIRLDNCKLKSLGWRVVTSLEDGVEETLLAYSSRGFGPSVF